MIKEKPKQKSCYDVKVECLIPTLLTYRIWADDENDALEQITKKAPTQMKPNLLLKKIIKATVYIAGSSVVKLTKSFR